ncbi:hypothetical protein HK103_002447 [Boothiomyces macroporosus]|uniref:Uncharacterized protein n=1 Tax=Boothiomyces macroporosus TaxID=261099 RepID=A0AAD5Y0C8_9FUNG|nr:hypothetical protein HK103_002447 [Boothiomyces macroporosus]
MISFLGQWLSNVMHIDGNPTPVKDCFHISLEKNMFWPQRKQITCLKANYIFIYVRLQPVFYECLHRQAKLSFNNQMLTGNFMISLRNQYGFKLEQVVDPNRRSYTKEPQDVIFSALTLNPKNIAVNKVKPEELCVKFKRMKLGITKDHEYINIRVAIYCENIHGDYILLDEWRSYDISVRFGNCAQYPDLRNISTKEREREYVNQLYNEISAFQKQPSNALLGVDNQEVPIQQELNINIDQQVFVSPDAFHSLYAF